MKVLLICSSYNGLTQRIHDELLMLKYEVSIELSISSKHMIEAVELFKPDLIVCPFLKEKIPSKIWENFKCIIIHPGIIGDRGASSLDWAIKEKKLSWGVTALQATQEMDAGDIWANSTFQMRESFKASIYRNEVTSTAVKILHKLIDNVKDITFKPEILDYSNSKTRGEFKPFMNQELRTINWKEDKTSSIINKINAADSYPGLLDTIYEQQYYLYGAHKEDLLKGHIAGEIIARRNTAICRATIDGAIWISHLRKKELNSFKLPATIVLKDRLKGIKENRIELLYQGKINTFKEIYYEQKDEVGYLHFDFHNGAMSIEQCVRLKYAYELACENDIKVIVLMGGYDFFANGIHLNVMQESLKQAEDGWSNIHSMNDIVKAVINSYEILTVTSFGANAGAGGVMLGIASDYVIAKNGTILNPHYKTLGLHGSEYWTYLLPKRVGISKAHEITENCLPLGSIRAKEINLVDEVFSENRTTYKQELEEFCQNLATSDDFYDLIDEKIAKREKDEATKPLESYRNEELKYMYESFYNEKSEFNKRRKEFVLKVPFSKTPKRLALHRKS